MKSVMFYHAETGLLHHTHLITSDDSLVALNTPAGHAPIDVVDGRRFDHMAERVDVERLTREDSDALTAWAETNGSQESRPRRPAATAAHVIDCQQPKSADDQARDVLRAARTKRTELQAAQHEHMVNLAIEPNDQDARTALKDIKAQIAALDSAV